MIIYYDQASVLRRSDRSVFDDMIFKLEWFRFFENYFSLKSVQGCYFLSNGRYCSRDLMRY